jgi:hypothetical protein
LYASARWKFLALFLLIRVCVRTPAQVRRCLWLVLAAAAVTAVVAIAQSLQAPGVAELTGQLFPGDEVTDLSVGRGSSTLGSSIATGDVLAFAVAICLALLARTRGPRRAPAPSRRVRSTLAGLALLYAVGALATGQFSAVLALVVAAAVVAVLTGQTRRLALAAAPVCLLAAVLLRPVIMQRWRDLDAGTGLPQSWQVRLDNLRTYVWPELFPGPGWVFGVRPSARIPADVPWGPYVYVESGHTWLLWTGGVPMLLAYLAFTVIAVRALAGRGRRHDAVGAAALAAVASVAVVFVLMTFDPHLTMRGAADLMFTLLALALTPGRPRSA